MSVFATGFIEWFASLFSVLLAAFAGSWLALRKTKRERVWEARYEAYRQILSAIHDMRYWAEEAYSANLCLPSVGSEKLRSLAARFDEAKHELSSFVHVGELLIAERSREALEDLVTAISKEEFEFGDDPVSEADFPNRYTDHCDRIRSIVSERLPGILELAKADIR